MKEINTYASVEPLPWRFGSDSGKRRERRSSRLVQGTTAPFYGVTGYCRRWHSYGSSRIDDSVSEHSQAATNACRGTVTPAVCDSDRY